MRFFIILPQTAPPPSWPFLLHSFGHPLLKPCGLFFFLSFQGHFWIMSWLCVLVCVAPSEFVFQIFLTWLPSLVAFSKSSQKDAGLHSSESCRTFSSHSWCSLQWPLFFSTFLFWILSLSRTCAFLLYKSMLPTPAPGTKLGAWGIQMTRLQKWEGGAQHFTKWRWMCSCLQWKIRVRRRCAVGEWFSWKWREDTVENM